MIKFQTHFKDFLSNLFLSLGTCVKVLLLSKFRNTIPTAKTNDIWIMANGPSLKTQLHLFNNNRLKIGVVNYFANDEAFEKVKPKYYFMQAPEFWIDDVLPSYIENRVKLFDNLFKKTSWEMDLFIPAKFKKFEKNYQPLIDNQFIKIHFYNDTPAEGLSAINHFFFNRQLGMPRPHNILIPSLMLSIYMNYQRIYILGADHSWLPEISVDDDNNALLSQKHFYDPDAKAQTMKKVGKSQRRLFEMLHKFYLMFRGYFDIKTYAESQNVKIINLTPNSYIDAFDRENLLEVLKEKETRKLQTVNK